MKRGPTTEPGIFSRIGGLLTQPIETSREENKSSPQSDDVVREVAEVAEAVEEAVEELAKENEESRKIEQAELGIERQMLKTLIASSKLSVRIFHISLFGTLIALLSLLVSLLRNS